MTHGGTSELSQKSTFVEIAAWVSAFLQNSTWEQEYQQNLTNFTHKLNKKHRKI